ncbi:hypothetical protein CTheo_7672 [Ceratobasidium theobromae]|uniref:Oxidoreductase n=1 Tax=Ceratobasidium theobromae TaxID=1582974 RepID=A0A5N5QBU2_9AGAM|nr:hypothetical protein CTheo_7672 [Ceratobasidium theobromae]
MGNLISQSFPPKSHFSVDQIPDLAGQVIIVTGGNAGVGKETCKALLNKNAKVYLAARNKSKADEAIERLKRETGGKAPIFLELNLADLASVRKAAEEFKSKEQELHVLFNNAGVMVPPVEQKTANGYDLQFGTNVLGHYFFTTLLMSVLVHTARTSPLAHGHARIVNTSSYTAYLAPKGGIVWETLRNDEAGAAACKSMGTRTLYAQSKLGNVLLSNQLAKRQSEDRVATASGRAASTSVGEWFLYPASYGALTQLWSGTMPEGELHNGKFLIPWARIGDAGPMGNNEQLGDKLWAWLEEQVKGF